MKAIAASILALAFSITLLPVAHAAEHCNAATIQGSYGFTFSGFAPDGNGNNVPFAGTGVVTNDGQGNTQGTVIGSLNGSVIKFPYTGTYVVHPNCSGTLTSTNGNANFSLAVVDGGNEVLGVATNGGTFTADLKRIY